MHCHRFTNVTILSEHMDTQSYGGAEGIFVSVKQPAKGGSVSLMPAFLSKMFFMVYQTECNVVSLCV